MALRKYTKEWLEELCATSYSYAEVVAKAGRKQGGGAQQTIKNKIAEWNIDISHFTGQRWYEAPGRQCNFTGVSREKYNIEDIFVKNCPVRRKRLREYILRHNLLEYKCQMCGCDGTWQGNSIALELDHIDGDGTNGELSNLRFLCPNCHASTETYRGRNIALKNQKEKEENSKNAIETIQKPKIRTKIASPKIVCPVCQKEFSPTSYNQIYCSQDCLHKSQQRVERPSREELKFLIRTKSFLEIGRQYGVTDNAIRKWCKAEGLPSKKKDIKSYSNEEWDKI